MDFTSFNRPKCPPKKKGRSIFLKRNFWWMLFSGLCALMGSSTRAPSVLSSHPLPPVGSVLFLTLAVLSCAAAPMLFGFELNDHELGETRYPVRMSEVNAWFDGKHRTIPIQNYNMGWQSATTLGSHFQHIRQIWNNYSIPMVTWQPYPYDTWISPTPNDDIVENTKQNASYHNYIYEFTERLASFVNGNDGVPDTEDDRRVYLRFAPEMNGDWYPWGPRHVGDGQSINQTSASFVRLWNFVIGRVRGKITSARQLQVVWGPNARDIENAPRAEEYFPKAEFVDWVAITGYNWGSLFEVLSWMTPETIYDDMLRRVRAIAPRLSVMLYTASTDLRSVIVLDKKKAWLKSVLEYAHQHEVGAVIYRNSNEGTPPHHFAVMWDAADKEGVPGTDDFVSPLSGRLYKVFNILPPLIVNDSCIQMASTDNVRLIPDELFQRRIEQPSDASLVPTLIGVAGGLLAAAIVGFFLYNRLRMRAKKRRFEEAESMSLNCSMDCEYVAKEIIAESDTTKVVRVVPRDPKPGAASSGQEQAAKLVYATDEEQCARLQNEIDLTYRCQKIPHIVRLLNTDLSWKWSEPASTGNQEVTVAHSVNTDMAQNATLLMKYYKDGDLATYISKQQKPLPPKFVAQVACHIAEALSRIHTLRNGAILHRQVKPENVLLEDGNAFLSDFSSAVLLKSKPHSALPVTAWSAPETADGHGSTTATDVWGVGCLLFAMMTRSVKERERVVRDVVQDSGAVEAMRSNDELGQYAPELVDLMFLCLSLAPAQRPITAELHAKLQKISSQC